MPQSASRVQIQAFNDLRLDGKFFQQMLVSSDEEHEDFDVYLMEKNVMPLLLQGLDALNRHVSKLATTSGAMKPFNPLTWLAQFLLRNHPSHVRDHRTPMYNQLRDLALIERGRRTLLRQSYSFEDAWRHMAKDGEHLDVGQIWLLLKGMDDAWNLEGQFIRKLPENLFQQLQPAKENKVKFEEFWNVFEAYVLKNDVLRASAFVEANERKRRAEREAQLAALEAQRREQALAEVMQHRKSMEEQFETLSADVYISSELSQIMSKGGVISLEDTDNSLPLQGEHIMLIILLLQVWGCPIDGIDPTVSQDEWDINAADAWRRWVQKYGPRDANPDVVDSVSLNALMDRDAFQAYLIGEQDGALDEDGERQVVEVKRLLEDDDLEIRVEAFDDTSQQLMQFAIPQNQVDEVRRRLALGQLVLAQVDLVSQRITELLPAVEDAEAGADDSAASADSQRG